MVPQLGQANEQAEACQDPQIAIDIVFPVSQQCTDEQSPSKK
jgi:hypothetical protein